MPGGALAVPQGNEVIPLINQLQTAFDTIIATKDWHPAHHGSFAINHPGSNAGDIIELDGIQQILWPVHCVQNTSGAAFAAGLNTDKIQKIFYKGTEANIDSYSAFYDNGHRQATGLADYLQQRKIEQLYLCGVATDYCVKYSALDACQLGFKTYLYAAACRGVNLQPDDSHLAIEEMRDAGVIII